ncbi:ATP-grasp domain-containing protein [Stigmatella aurantiaca]|uniref:Conserved uncharacterized protein n=1 Tax=Stigmatella aurantiaca (strain DW4/3-1) TaxID=378806 RepID=Q09AS2_STIAD|nr:hypothetical protein [Stigmatella aurantiaca]ADO74848.1 conserved uncharacterized protein [Stigmatella aurantiaca DW4/3-1]EAU68816.1 conserved hypothetical protein [Stigmatella aurantiaca DW4/3-1]
MDIAIVTYPGLPELDAHDALLVPALASLGLKAQPCVWDDPRLDWSLPKVAVVRSVWDSHLRRDAFVDWATRVGQRTRLYNPPEVLRWNTHKAYLRELQAQGIALTPTVWVPPGGSVDVDALMRERGWQAVVLKPVVSADALKTYRFAHAEAARAQAQLALLAAEGEVMVQPYLTAFDTEGERAYIFFDGAFSHAVRRPPGLKDAPRAFQTPHRIDPWPEELRLAQDVLAAVGQPLLYARVDVATDLSGHPCLQELEATEPGLFLGLEPHAPLRLAQAIARKV